MHFVLDLQACQSPESRRRGIGRYSLALAKAMATHSQGHCISVLLNGAMAESIELLRAEFDGILPTERLVVWGGLEQTAQIDGANSFRRAASEVLREHALQTLRPDVVHVASLVEGLADDVVCTVPERAAYVTAVTLYDLIPLVHQETYLADPRVRRWYLGRLEHLRRADLLCGISRFSCEEARELLGAEHVVDISGAADDCFRRLPEPELFRQELMRRYGLTRAFLMYAGGFDARKNVAGLIRAFSRLPATLRREHQLAIAGGAPEPERQALDQLVVELGLGSEEVVFLGYVPDADLVKLYNLCALYVFPSLQEGFGLPALEAMCSGAVVIGSGTSSLPEVIGFPEALFDPRDDQSIASAIAMALTDASFRSRFQAHARHHTRSFSWEESARRAIESFEMAVKRSAHRPLTSSIPQAVPVVWLPAPDPRPAPSGGAHIVYADPDCHGIVAKHRLSDFDKSSVGEHATVLLELADDPYCAKTLLLAETTRADLDLRQPGLGSAMHALARMPEGRRLVELLLYRSGGYHALAAAKAADFSAQVLSKQLTALGLAAHGKWQVTRVDAAAVDEMRDRLAWREHTKPFIERIVSLQGAAGAAVEHWQQIADALSRRTGPVPGSRQWFIDISNLAVHDAGTGIQRVVRHVLDELMKAPPEGVRVEPVRMGDDGVLRYARGYCQRRYFPSASVPPDEPVAFDPGDVFLGLDLAAHLIPQNIGTFRHMRDRGVKLLFVVYDLLPLIRPECFDRVNVPLFRAWYAAIAQVADGVICISRSVADEFENWLHQEHPKRRAPVNLGWFHLGADLAPQPEMGGRLASGELGDLGQNPTLLMVGTVEPRKGHAQVLDAFEHLWRDGVEANLLVIGKPGWLVEDLLERMREHPERGRRLFWFEQAGDGLLLAAYRRADALLMASEGEGFGLPLIEAAHHGLPLIARDLPVFREIAGDHAFYFSGFSGEALAQRLHEWLGLAACGTTPSSSGMRWKTWAEATADLVQVIQNERWYRRWRPGFFWRFAAFDYRLTGGAGRLDRGRLRSVGRDGLLMAGPGIPLAAGRYELRLLGGGRGGVSVRILADGREVMRVANELVLDEVDGLTGSFDFRLDDDATDWRVELSVGAAADVFVVAMELRLIGDCHIAG
ncbi:MAG TPA: glycosyltransferase family 1 protein [Frateuria sp.]|uniref:glycosyltransferase family 4 protein n=1 Tax=Frateuria sp. TaxID=2211372 RepID=UPI002D80423D|nr:glycosyltransferase family 1 protein [Frateuria sp.]HET6805049.1 glycosyltransferase family 1 protein [Frateuria sp.]